MLPTEFTIDPFGLISLMLSILVTLIVGYWSVRNPLLLSIEKVEAELKKIQEAMKKQSGVLKREQAEQLCHYYLQCLQTDLFSEARQFFEHELTGIQQVNQGTEARLFVINQTQSRIQEHRSKLSSLLVGPGYPLNTFLDKVSPVDGPVIQKAKDEVIKLFDQTIAGALTSQQAVQKILPLIVHATNETMNQIKVALNELYH